MSEFLNALLAFPTVAFTAMLGVSLFYWLLVIIGAADLNPFDGAEGAMKGAVEGAVKGAVEGSIKGVIEGAADTAGEAVGAVKGASALTEALSWLGLTKVPITISFSAFSLSGWFLSFAARHFLDPLLPGALSAIAAGAVSVVGGIFLAGLAVRPLAGIFDDKERAGGTAHRGKTVKITTDRVDERSGQAELEDGGGGLTINVRCAPGNGLKRGDEAVIMDVDVKEGIYFVEPLRAVLPSTQDAFEAAGITKESASTQDAQAAAPNPSTNKNLS
jgi:Protein of unknown function (DUF1449)